MLKVILFLLISSTSYGFDKCSTVFRDEVKLASYSVFYDKEKYIAHLTRLSPGDRYLRFQGMVSDEGIRNYVSGKNLFKTIFVGYFVNNVLRGAAEINLLNYDSAEIALSVESRYQGQSVGNQLMRKAIRQLVFRGIKTIKMSCLTKNSKVRKLILKMDGKVDYEGSEASGEIEVERDDLAFYEESIQVFENWWTMLLGNFF